VKFPNQNYPKAFAVWLVLVSFVGSASAQVWTKTSAPNKSWYAVATSADGIKLAAAFQSSGGIYTSTNSGATWILTSAPAKSWTALASSADGSVLLATANFGGIYASTNSGISWQSNNIPGNAQWDTAAASADGNTLIVGATVFGSVYYSTNMGANWRSNGIPKGYWTSVVCSGDGTKLAAEYNGTIYVSTNSGVAWTNYNTLGTVLACSADGRYLVLNSGPPTVSTNWGATWTQISLPSTSLPFALSADATRFVVLGNGVIYVSTNLGGLWSSSYAPALAWRSIALSSTGTKLVAVSTSSSDGVYVWLPPALSFTNNAGSLIYSWPTNGTIFSLQANPDLATTNWVAVTNVPVIANSRKQVTLPVTNGNGFFRLISQ